MEKEKTDKMKAPDKIVVQEGAIMRTEKVYNNDIEYFRKDFLIDKLAHAKALREKSGSKDTEVFDALTNLIQEM